jgi:cytochrome P450
VDIPLTFIRLAGADSTSSLISSFVLTMTLYPEIQKRAQDEIDRVVGRDRLPTFEDRAELPFLECIMRELYRWNPAAPMAVTHRLMKDDEYEGYFIPGGTTVIPNIWSDDSSITVVR